MTAMMEPLDSNSNSYDSDSHSSLHSKPTSKINSTNSKTNILKYKPIIKSKFLCPKHKNNMQRF